MNKNTRNALWIGAGLALAGQALLQKLREIDLTGQVVLITGGSRGLGLALAQEFAKQGSRLALCARDAEELARAKDILAQKGAEVFTHVCDVSDQTQVEKLITAVTAHYGRVDILVNNAGIIEVGPVQNLTKQNFEDALNVDFWGVFHLIFALLPQMRARQSGRIVTIASIGGKVAFPHLLPYTTAKFATTALSEGLRSELSRDGIVVTTIVPGLLRTGSYFHALFQGEKAAEFTWFSLGDTLPGVSISAERAAREIVRATRRGEAERILSFPATLLALAQGIAPGATSGLLTLINNLTLPPPSDKADANIPNPGKEIAPDVPARPVFETVTGLGIAAAERLNE